MDRACLLEQFKWGELIVGSYFGNFKDIFEHFC